MLNLNDLCGSDLENLLGDLKPQPEIQNDHSSDLQSDFNDEEILQHIFDDLPVIRENSNSNRVCPKEAFLNQKNNKEECLMSKFNFNSK